MRAITTLRLEKEADIARLRQVGVAICESLRFADFARTRAVTAMIELGRNAVEYAEKGRGRLSLAELKGKVALRLVVSDQGRGIDDLDRMLGSDRVMSSGLGLGLRGVRRIADRFEIESGPEGTVAEVWFATGTATSELDRLATEATEALARLDKGDPVAQLSAQNRDLREALASRELLIEEIHHRTGNNLSLISALIRMSRGAAKSAETREVLADLESRVHAVIKAHEHLRKGRDAETVELVSFLRGVAGSAEDAFSGGDARIAVSVDGPETMIEGSTAIDLGLIVGELVTNAFKHAFVGRSEGRIDVRFHREGENARLEVVDDGRGLPPDVGRPERSNSLGWRLIRTLAQEHGGVLTVDGSDGFRTVIEFEGLAGVSDKRN